MTGARSHTTRRAEQDADTGTMNAASPSRRPEDTLIRIGTPLPMDVAGTLLRAIGTVYPSAGIVADSRPSFSPFGGGESAMVISIKPEDRYDGPLDIEPDRIGPDDVPVDFVGFSMDEESRAWISTAPSKELCLYLGNIAHRIFTATEGASNFVEWSVNTAPDATDDDGNPISGRYVLTVARAPYGQDATTPSNLLAQAKERIAELEAELALLRGAED